MTVMSADLIDPLADPLFQGQIASNICLINIIRTLGPADPA